MSKINQGNLFSGIRKAEIYGRHRLEQYKIYEGQNSLKVKKEGGKSKLNQKSVEDAEFGANNVDRRGLRNKLEFRGHMPVRWMPDKDFKREAVGYSDDGGAFKGGEDGNKKGGKKDYSQSFGVAGKKGLNPFPIKVSKSIKV